MIDLMVWAEEGEAELDEGIGEEDGVGLLASLLDRCTPPRTTLRSAET